MRIREKPVVCLWHAGEGLSTVAGASNLTEASDDDSSMPTNRNNAYHDTSSKLSLQLYYSLCDILFYFIANKL